MSGSNLKETDPALRLYEAEAIIIEKNQEIEQMRQKIKRLRIDNSNKNQLELAQKVTKLEEDLAVSKVDNLQLKEQIAALHLNISTNDKLSDRFETLEFAVNQKVEKLEADLTSKNNNFAELLENLSMQQNRSQEELSQKMSKIEEDLADNLAGVVTKLVEKLERDLASKVEKLEEELVESKNKNFDLINRLLSLELNVKQLNEKDKLSQQNLMLNGLVKSDLFERFLAQKAVRVENKVEKQSGGQQNTSILILGDRGFKNTIYLLDSKAKSWKKLRITIPMGMEGFGAVVLNEAIYIFGGATKSDYQQDCYKLKDDGSWMQLASMDQKRGCISSSSLVYKRDIWVIGGYSGYSDVHLKSVEKYDISQNKWTYMPGMNHPRSHAAAAVFKDRIFVTGGRSENFLKSVEMFDPKLQKWILFCDLPIGLFAHTMLISNSTLSIFGGSSSARLNSVWEMDIEDPEKKWTEKQSFKHPRCYFGIGKLSNGIIVFGNNGYNGETSEIFDGNKWIDGPKLRQKLSFFAYTSIPRSLEESFLKKFS